MNILVKFIKDNWLSVLICVVLAFFVVKTMWSLNYYKTEYSKAANNNKAYQEQLDDMANKSVVFQMDLNTLEACNDSLMRWVNALEKENKVKDKEISQLNYLKSELSKTDTVRFFDTIFREPDFVLDTLIGDVWMNTKLLMRYPNFISVTPSVKSEKVVMIYQHKETVNPPKKFFLFRWFQKKHTVCRAVVDEKNPYIKNEANEFYQIVD